MVFGNVRDSVSDLFRALNAEWWVVYSTSDLLAGAVKHITLTYFADQKSV